MYHRRMRVGAAALIALTGCLCVRPPAACARSGAASAPSSQPATPETSPASRLSPAKAGESERAAGFAPLFNGKDLSGWRHRGKEGSFRVKDGILLGDRTGRNDLAYWLSTEREYGDFELRLQFKLSPNGNSGIFIRVPPEGWPSMAGMEIQLLDDTGRTGQPTVKDTGSIYRIVAPTAFASNPAGQWNDLWILCDGDRVRITMNAKTILDASMNDYEKLKDHPRKGFIGLSAHTFPVQFRNIQLRTVKK